MSHCIMSFHCPTRCEHIEIPKQGLKSPEPQLYFRVKISLKHMKARWGNQMGRLMAKSSKSPEFWTIKEHIKRGTVDSLSVRQQTLNKLHSYQIVQNICDHHKHSIVQISKILSDPTSWASIKRLKVSNHWL